MVPYVVEQNQNQSLVRFSGDLTAGLVPDLQNELKSALGAGTTDLVFDLENSVMLDSSGMGLLIAAANSLGRIGGHMSVINVSPDILRLLQSMRLATRLNATGNASKENSNG